MNNRNQTNQDYEMVHPFVSDKVEEVFEKATSIADQYNISLEKAIDILLTTEISNTLVLIHKDLKNLNSDNFNNFQAPQRRYNNGNGDRNYR